MRTANPALNENVFRDAVFDGVGVETMTVSGAINKTAILLFLVLAASAFTWKMFFDVGIQAVYPWMLAGIFGGLIFGLLTIIVKKWAAFTSPIYAVLEGFFLGGISSVMETVYPGIVIQAIGLTFGVLIALLTIYRTGVIKVTDKFRLGIFAATGAICLVYIVSFIMGFFGSTIPYIHGSGPIGIGFSLFVVAIASLNLVLDFDFIERGSAAHAPKYMEWYAAFGLMVTLIWLYIEILRLLSKLRNR